MGKSYTVASSASPSVGGTTGMNEAPDKKTPDWVIAGDLTVDLRAECDKNGSVRVYTITVECTDVAGYISTASTTVTVTNKHAK